MSNKIENAEAFDGKHNFLAEELLVPMANRCDVMRLNMFSSHFAQTVVLDEPERPRVFSRFENAFGRYTTAVRGLPADAKIVGVFEKNALQTVYALEYDNGMAGLHFAAPVRHLTETYGYKLKQPLLGRAVGDALAAGTCIQSWPCTDEHGNFQYGVNLKTVYMNLDGLTYEDGLVISESASRRLTHTSVETFDVVLNANDFGLNLYGDHETWKCFPDVGEEIQDGVLMARRRINHESILFDLSADQIGRVHWDGDTVFYASGRVVDVDIFSNLDDNALDKHAYNAQTLSYFRRWVEFRDWILATFEPYIEGRDGKLYGEDVAYWYRVCRDSLENKWTQDATPFEGVVLRFTVAKEHAVKPGSKITNRWGGKGVISEIRPDAEMPRTEDGLIAELAVNSLGVVNRLNSAQLFESELNFIADEIARRMRADPSEAGPLLLDFLSRCSPGQAKWLKEHTPQADLEAIVREIVDGEEDIPIEQPPFFGNISLEGMRDLYEHYGVERSKFVGIEEPLILGTNYYMKLRHEPSSKFSARSAKHLSIANVPTKNSRGTKMGTEHHSSTPIRLGEQELQNLLIANNPQELRRLLRLYATDDVSREGAITELLTREDPFSDEQIEVRGDGTTRPTAGLQALFEHIGFELVEEEESEKETKDD